MAAAVNSLLRAGSFGVKALNIGGLGLFSAEFQVHRSRKGSVTAPSWRLLAEGWRATLNEWRALFRRYD
jgi:hypothetical protein